MCVLFSQLALLRRIVSGAASVDFTLQFLNRKSNTDIQLLEVYKVLNPKP